MDIREMIQNSFDKIEAEREDSLKNSGYMVQYCPCGHFREIKWYEKDLITIAKLRKNHDALIRSSDECFQCIDEYLFGE